MRERTKYSSRYAESTRPHATRTFSACNLLLVLLVTCHPTLAQSITEVEGSAASISVGKDDGVKVGMTGKICSSESISGRTIDVCPAAFEVTAVSSNSAKVRITMGDSSAISARYLVKFDQGLEKPASPPPPSPKSSSQPAPRKNEPQELTAETLFELGNQFSSMKSYAEAARHYRLLFERYPDHPLANASRSLAEAAEKLRDQDSPPASVDEATRPRNLEAELLLSGADRLAATGDWEGAAAAYRRFGQVAPDHALADTAARLAVANEKKAEKEREQAREAERVAGLVESSERFLASGDLETAAKVAQEAIDLSPGNDRAAAALARARQMIANARGVLCFCRTQRLLGWAVDIHLEIDGRKFVDLDPRTYACFSLPAGKHQVKVGNFRMEALVERNQTDYTIFASRKSPQNRDEARAACYAKGMEPADQVFARELLVR